MSVVARPLVSVVVTFYNQAEFVASALDGVLAQTYHPVEVIAVDDGSTDDTLHACAAYGDRITVIHQDNAGPSRARNAGLQRAHGALVAFLDGDDLWAPEKLEVQVEAARGNPQSGLVAVDGTAFSSAGITQETLYRASLVRLLQTSDARFFTARCFDMLLDGKFSIISTPSQVMIPAAVLGKVGTWDPRFRVSADYELYLRIAAHWPFTFARERLVRYRINPAGLSGPEPTRAFSWVEDKPAIFRAIAGGDRRRAARLISELARETARDAYDMGERGHRRLANHFLMRYVLRSGRPHIVLPYLVVLWLPSGLRARLRAALRRPTKQRT
ncbi:MAG: glycosyltransferase family 2 protein [Candidatus Rokuibacteriota bacterium]